MGRRRGRQLFRERLYAIERPFDPLPQFGGRLTAALRPEAAPVEGVIPRLSSVIEDRNLLRLAGSRGDDLFQWKVGKFGGGDQFIQRIDVSLVMLAIVKVDRPA